VPETQVLYAVFEYNWETKVGKFLGIFIENNLPQMWETENVKLYVECYLGIPPRYGLPPPLANHAARLG